MLDLPTIGVAKNLFHVDGIVKDKERALRTSDEAEKPVYVSVGHKISLETAAWLTGKCSLYRIPEPIRQADILSRDFLRNKFPDQFP